MGIITDAVGSWIGGKQEAKGEERARDASQEAADKQLALYRDIYNQQRADQMPWLQQGSQAANLLGQFYGFTPSTVPGAQAPAGQAPATNVPQQPQANQLSQNPLFAAFQQRMSGQAPGAAPEVYAAPDSAQPIPTSVSNTAPQTAPTSPLPTGTTAPTQTPQQQAMDKFFASPDYQFRLNEGNRNILGQAAATGGLQSGDTLKALQGYGQNMASGEFGNYWNRLAGLAGVGQTAAGNVGNAGNSFAQGSAGAIGQNAANRGSSYIRSGQNWSDTTGDIIGGISQKLNALGGSFMGGGF